MNATKINATDWQGQKRHIYKLGRHCARLIRFSETTKDKSLAAQAIAIWAEYAAEYRQLRGEWRGFHSDLHGIFWAGFESVY